MFDIRPEATGASMIEKYSAQGKHLEAVDSDSRPWSVHREYPDDSVFHARQARYFLQPELSFYFLWILKNLFK
jgi:hypothetical protein